MIIYIIIYIQHSLIEIPFPSASEIAGLARASSSSSRVTNRHIPLCNNVSLNQPSMRLLFPFRSFALSLLCSCFLSLRVSFRQCQCYSGISSRHPADSHSVILHLKSPRGYDMFQSCGKTVVWIAYTCKTWSRCGLEMRVRGFLSKTPRVESLTEPLLRFHPDPVPIQFEPVHGT